MCTYTLSLIRYLAYYLLCLLRVAIKCSFIKKGQKYTYVISFPYLQQFLLPQHLVMLPELIYRLNSLISSSIKRNLVNMQLHLHNWLWGTLSPKIILNKEMKSECSSERGSQNGNIPISFQTRLHFITFEKSVSYFVIISQCQMPNYCVNQETSFVLDWCGKEYNFFIMWEGEVWSSQRSTCIGPEAWR